jgi:hypothetical protein
MENKGEIIIYQTEDGESCLDVRLDQETIWLNLNQLVKLFEPNKTVISRHIKKFFKGGA